MEVEIQRIQIRNHKRNTLQRKRILFEQMLHVLIHRDDVHVRYLTDQLQTRIAEAAICIGAVSLFTLVLGGFWSFLLSLRD